MKKSNLKVIVFYIVIIAVALLVVSMFFNSMGKVELKFSDVERYFRNEDVKSFEINESSVLTFTTKDGHTFSYRLQSFALFYEEFGELVTDQYNRGVLEDFNYPQPHDVYIPWWVSFLPYVLLIALFVGLWFYAMRQTTGRGGKLNTFGKSRAKISIDNKNKVRFKDVAGADEEKEELKEIVEFLRDPARYSKLGARIPHGVLLVGPPGTGKTLLAKAVAGEAGVPFFSISGSDFVEMYVGVGASRVRDLFETARKSSAAIIFIDEIDAVGRHRGAGLGGGHDEREQTLNQLLVEMDGFGSQEGIIVMAATNRPDILDPALLRPGRFDRQVTVGYPDIRGREDILRVHAVGKPFEKDIDLHKIAQSTAGFTGADLANLLNEAALLAARKRKSLIGMNDIEEASLKITVGLQKKKMEIKPKEKLKTAYHEAGHAILAHVLPTQDPVRRISIIPSGRALGYTLTPPAEDKYSVYKNGLMEQIAMLLGGRVAEQIIFDDISGGASNDIQRATNIARSMVVKYGMSDVLGPIVFGSEHSDDEVFLGRDFNNTRNYSEETASKIDAEIKKIIDTAYRMAEDTLRAHMDKLHFIAEYLVKDETMDEAQFTAAMDGNPTIEELEKMVEDQKRRSEEENAARQKIEEEEAQRRQAEEERMHREASETNDQPPSDSNDTL